MSMASIGLKTHIWNNNVRCLLLLGFYPVLLGVMVWGVSWILGTSLHHQNAPKIYNSSSALTSFQSEAPIHFANSILLEFWPLILGITIIWFLIAWFFHTSMIRNLSHSHPVTRADEPELYNLLENLCIAQGVAVPRLEIIESHARNAFASGIDQKSYSITVTRGLMNSLAKDELEGVLAHELTHIINRDVRLLIVCVIFTGMFGFAAQMAWSNIRYHTFYAPRRRDNQGGAIFVILAIALILWLGYIATLFMRFALSRRREYMADAGAVEMTKNPEAMMRALMRIAGRDRMPQTTDDIAMMCIENHVPFLGLFATHPPIEKRIQAISKYTGTAMPLEKSLAPVSPDGRYIQSQPAQQQNGARPNPWLIRGRRP